jgi:hypothetical protein
MKAAGARKPHPVKQCCCGMADGLYMWVDTGLSRRKAGG